MILLCCCDCKSNDTIGIKMKMETEELIKSAEKIDWTQVEMMDLKIRPWVKINGVIHKKILDYMIISLLYRFSTFQNIKQFHRK